MATPKKTTTTTKKPAATTASVTPSNQIDPSITEQIRAVSMARWEKELKILEDMHDRNIPDPDDKDYFKIMTFRGNALKTQMAVVRDQAKNVSGAIQIRKNTVAEKKLRDDLIEVARERLEAKGHIVPQKNPNNPFEI